MWSSVIDLIVLSPKKEQKEKAMRLINADALTHTIGIRLYTGETMEFVSKEDIDAQPTIDAVPVVRCKECRWGREACGNIECNVDLNIPSEYHGYEWFCPNGERKKE